MGKDGELIVSPYSGYQFRLARAIALYGKKQREEGSVDHKSDWYIELARSVHGPEWPHRYAAAVRLTSASEQSDDE